MRRQTEQALDEADVVALRHRRARGGRRRSTRSFAEMLRRRGKPVVLVANKAEGRAGDAGALEAFGLGLGEPVPISAEHGEGLADLYDALIAAARPAERRRRGASAASRRCRSPSSGGRTPASRPWSTA